MNFIKKAYCRVFQTGLRAALPFLPYREPKPLHSVGELVPLFSTLKVGRVLLVTDGGLRAMGATKALEECLSAAGVFVAVYDGTCANPTVKNVEEARRVYLDNKCEALIAFGGGSPIDCAKAVGARIAYPKKSMDKLRGLLRVLRRIPTLVAIPTTAGTGSETTLAAVITDGEKHHKYTMNDFTLIPRYAVLDPDVTLTLPPRLTATTGMDALTHAVEAFIGRSTTRETRRKALEATALVFANVQRAYANGKDREARAGMLRAAYLAGIAFSKSYVGYVHAVAHSLGGQYNIPHGLANAVLLPVVLEAYGKKVHKKLHRLAVAAGIARAEEPHEEGAKKFICAVKSMNAHMNIPTSFPEIRREDVPKMARYADEEANPLYPVPKLMNAKELEQFYYATMEENK